MNQTLFGSLSDGATELDPGEREGLIPSHVSLRRELDEAESSNILKAERWVLIKKRDVLSEQGLKLLHKKMFGRVWQWAGTFRKTERNIGIDPIYIATRLHMLLDDVRFWIDKETYAPDEIAVRFHHQLVYIHLFPNGNGRHARLASDILIQQLKGARFSWGQRSMVTPQATRQSYLAALRKADHSDISDLLQFARS